MSNPYETANVFAADFRRMEYALKRSSYVRKNKKHAQADWDRFAQDLGADFFDHVMAEGIAKTLIAEEPSV